MARSPDPPAATPQPPLTRDLQLGRALGVRSPASSHKNVDQCIGLKNENPFPQQLSWAWSALVSHIFNDQVA